MRALYLFSLLLPHLTAGQFQEPWIELAADSVAYTNFSDVTADAASATIAEDIPINTVVFLINRLGSAPAVTTCNQFNLASDEPYNNVSRLVLKFPFDYESDKTATCIFYAFSDDRLEVRQLNIQVLDVNDNRPFFTEGNNNSLSFPEKAKGIVYAFSATDADQVDNNTLNFSFKMLSGSGQHFELKRNPTTGQGELSVVTELDYETEASFVFQISVSDSLFSSTIPVALQVVDVNDQPPFWLNERPVYVFDEEQPAGTQLFQVEARDGDRSINSNINYTLTGGSDNFKIDVRTGWVSSRQVIDRDSLQEPFFAITITATEEDAPYYNVTSDCTVNIGDINDNRPSFDDAPYTFSVPENTDAGYYVGSVRATDMDQNNVISYEISGCSPGAYVQIGRSTGLITVSDTIDYETTSSIQCSVSATDSGSPPMSNTTQLYLNVVDLNDGVPQFNETGPIDITVPEDISNGTVLRRLHADDTDSGALGQVTYLFSSSNIEGGDRFAVNATTGELSVCLVDGAVVDYESKSSFSFLVEARDNYRPGIVAGSNSDTIRINIRVSDVNDETPQLPVDQGPCLASPFETLVLGERIVDIRAVDGDEPGTNNSRIEYAIERVEPLTDQPLFEFRPGADNDVQLVAATNLTGYPGTYSVNISVHDWGTPRLGSWRQYAICVQDVNDNSPVFTFPSQSNDRVDVFENNTLGPVLWRDASGQLTPLVFQATDADSDENARVTFVWSDGGGNPTQVFDLRPDGALYLLQTLDRAVSNQYQLRVTARDHGSPVFRSQDTSLNLNVRLATPHAPTFEARAQTFNVTENLIQVLFFAEASDVDNENSLPDETPEPVYYYLVDGNRDDFVIEDRTAARLKTVRALDREDPPPHLSVIIQVSNEDRPSDALDCSQTDCTTASFLAISIEILDENDNDPVFQFPPDQLQQVDVFENNTVGPVLWRKSLYELTPLVFQASDVDQGENGRVDLSWSPETENPTDVFELADDGSVRLLRTLNRTVANRYQLRVRAQDNAAPTTGGGGGGGPRHRDAALTVNVRLAEQHVPTFEPRRQTLSLTENQLPTSSFIEASDVDNENSLPDESQESVYYYLIDGNRDNFAIEDRTMARLKTVRALDREEPPRDLFVIVETSNEDRQFPSADCSRTDCSQASFLNITIEILDENDCWPAFSGTFSGAIAAGDQRGKVLLTLTSQDDDLDDGVVYELNTTVSASDPSLSMVATPFRIRPETNELLLDFDVDTTMKGFLSLTVYATDNAEHRNETEIRIFVVTQENRVIFTFSNAKEDVERNRFEIERIFSDVYEYRCIVQSVQAETPSQADGAPSTTVFSHFVDENTNEPVVSSVIESFRLDFNKTRELKRQFALLDLILEEVRSEAGPPADPVQQVFLILFIVACLIAVALLGLLIAAVWRGLDLKRKVKALSSTKFSSIASTPDADAKNAAVPNTNQHAVQGSNPMWSMHADRAASYDNDSVSVSSGDSILIGVENNAQFRSRQPPPRSNPSLQPTALPFQNVQRQNPLAQTTAASAVHGHDAGPPMPLKRKAPPPPPFVDKNLVIDQDYDYDATSLTDDDQSGRLELDSNFDQSEWSAI